MYLYITYVQKTMENEEKKKNKTNKNRKKERNRVGMSFLTQKM